MGTSSAADSARPGRVAQRFRTAFGSDPEGVWRAPGRVNLIGDHTDYNGGFVLPVAIDRSTMAAVARRRDGVVRGWSEQCGSAKSVVLDELADSPPHDWLGYAAGVAWALRERGVDVGGFDVAIDSDVPVGGGLSSSAALECAVGLALCELADARLDPKELALVAQSAEQSIVGAPVGVMDQTIALLGRAGHALFLDCRSLTSRQLPFDLSAADVALLVVDTNVKHTNAGGGYATRRSECERAAAQLGVTALRDATADQADGLEPVLARRVRHVVTENARVLQAAEALSNDDTIGVGPLLSASHASLRDDFEVSIPELDLAVSTALECGAYGARMTGGGFGGCAVALVATADIDDVSDGVRAAFRRAEFAEPTLFVAHTSDGAKRLDL
ncbi:MAG: galactokinase [Actinomycetes bacterium]